MDKMSKFTSFTIRQSQTGSGTRNNRSSKRSARQDLRDEINNVLRKSYEYRQEIIRCMLRDRELEIPQYQLASKSSLAAIRSFAAGVFMVVIGATMVAALLNDTRAQFLEMAAFLLAIILLAALPVGWAIFTASTPSIIFCSRHGLMKAQNAMLALEKESKIANEKAAENDAFYDKLEQWCKFLLGHGLRAYLSKQITGTYEWEFRLFYVGRGGDFTEVYNCNDNDYDRFIRHISAICCWNDIPIKELIAFAKDEVPGYDDFVKRYIL